MSYERKQHAGGAVVTTLGSDITSGDTSLSLAAATGWPDGSVGPFYLVIDASLSNEEKILVTSRTSSTLNGLTRGVDGTAAASHSSGATISHCFTAVEADEANVAAHETVGAVTTKGDILAATANQALGRVAVGADDSVLIADAAQTAGLKYAKIGSAQITDGGILTADLADGAVTTAKIPDSNVTTAKLADSAVTTAKINDAAVTSAKIADATIATGDLADGAVTTAKLGDDAATLAKLHQAIHVGTVSGTTDGSGNFVVTHGADFTPSAVFVQMITPAGGANAGHPVVTAIGATTFSGRMIGTSGSVAGLSISLYWLAVA